MSYRSDPARSIMFCHFHYFEVRFWNACETCQNWKIDRKSLTCSLMARSSAIRFLEFINAWPHCGQSTSLWLHLWHNKWPSGHWYIGGLSAVSKHTGHSSVFSKSLILASVWNTKSGFRLHFQLLFITQCLKIIQICLIWIFQFWHFYKFLSF